MEAENSIRTIGYGNRSIEAFLEVLKKHKTKYLIDVRSVPFSRYKPEYSKPELSKYLENHDIRYVFMGEELGGRPEGSDYYDENDQIVYDLLKESNAYQCGIDRLCRAYEQGQAVTLMCSELKPENCHRSALIGETLVEKRVKVEHIDQDDKLSSHQKVVERRRGSSQLSLMPQEEGFKSRKKYPRRSA